MASARAAPSAEEVATASALARLALASAAAASPAPPSSAFSFLGGAAPAEPFIDEDGSLLLGSPTWARGMRTVARGGAEEKSGERLAGRTASAAGRDDDAGAHAAMRTV